MNLRILKKQCKKAMHVLIEQHGYTADKFMPADGGESINAPTNMERRFARSGWLEPGPLPGTPLLWEKASYEYDEWDARLPSEVLEDVIFWSDFKPDPLLKIDAPSPSHPSDDRQDNK